MSIRLNPQEIYLLERFISLHYFGALRDTWAEMVDHVDVCLQQFMKSLDPLYRSRPLPEQPDIVWGQRVLPNFRDTLLGLDTGFILLSHGDVKGLTWANGPENDFKGQLEYSCEWMSPEDQNLYHSLLLRATTMAGNITATEGAYWLPLELSNFSEQRGPLDPPAAWPAYRVNRGIAAATGSKLPRSGIYVPDIDDSCAEFLSTNYSDAPSAPVHIGYKDLRHPSTGEKYGEQPMFKRVDCTWYLVERANDVNFSQQNQSAGPRVAAGEACPASGFYFTPARPESRRSFKKGEVMPTFDTEYGATIWQWDNDQS